MATTGRKNTAVEEAAILEAELRQARDAELQEALQVTTSAASSQAFAVEVPTELTVSDVEDEQSPHSDTGEEEEEGGPKVTTPLVYQSNILMNTG